MPRKVLMLGWEFPPFISGGLGTACAGLVAAMTKLDVDVTLVLPMDMAGDLPGAAPAAKPSAPETPKAPEAAQGPEAYQLKRVPSAIRSPYPSASTGGWRQEAQSSASAEPARRSEFPGQGFRVIGAGAMGGYDGNLLDRIDEYARRCAQVAGGEDFDVIHAHDWVTYPAGLAIAKASGRPLVIHVHSTEFDRSGEHVNPDVYAIERQGMWESRSIIAVSCRTKTFVSGRYGVAEDKVRVVHNGIEQKKAGGTPRPDGAPRTVLFLGRITMQKGPEFFLHAARRVLEKESQVRFVMAGWGDMGPEMVERVADMRLGDRFHFTGFLRGREVDRAYQMSDVYVMPSVSEPFGLTALEALQYGLPVVLSKSSGVAEVLHRGALKVDFWDVDAMATDILSVLRRPELRENLKQAGLSEVRGLTWEKAARKCVAVYDEQAGVLVG